MLSQGYFLNFSLRNLFILLIVQSRLCKDNKNLLPRLEMYSSQIITVCSIFATDLTISEKFLAKHTTKSWGNIRQLNLMQLLILLGNISSWKRKWTLREWIHLVYFKLAIKESESTGAETVSALFSVRSPACITVPGIKKILS
jgi:hypothetical protein